MDISLNLIGPLHKLIQIHSFTEVVFKNSSLAFK